MPLICFFGPDGSGKSTLAKALAGEFRSRGLKVRVSWMRGTHTISSLIAKLLSRFEVFKGGDNPYYRISIPPRLRKLWQFIEFTSFLPILFLKFYLPSLYSIVICDRYVPDFIVWISLTTNDPRFEDSFLGRFLLKLSLKADVRIYVTASLEELMKRKKEYNVGFISKQLVAYSNIERRINAYRLDTTNEGVEDSLRKVLRWLNIA